MRKQALHRFCCMVAFIVLSACATPPTADAIRSADYGNRPHPELMPYAVKNYMSKFLFDPYSAVYNCSTPRKAWVIAGVSGDRQNVNTGETYYGYFSTCTINAKNRFGGYTGAQEYDFLIHSSGGKYRLYHFGAIPRMAYVH